MSSVTSAVVVAHEVSGGAGAATISALTAAAMGLVLLLLLALVFVRRATSDSTPASDEAPAPRS
jgi:hypothetical protein